MPYPRIERRSGTYAAPAGGGNTNLFNIAPGERVIAFACNVRVAGNGTGTVSFGKTASVAAFMATGDVAANAVGKKYGATGADLAGNGTAYAAATQALAAYTVGTNTTHPVIEWVALVIRDELFKDLLVQ
ncbi:MAG TPA: hypothetical protein VFC53_01505 [Dehalococcoidia bacterium]|nr:hypothetical protein [Dehalococcoidia bacterium]